PEDMYLVLGDNREISLDSRKIGLIKKSDINGKISFRFWPLNKMKFF
ncbi:MAG: signal peptidase I, partial [Bacilli bacterium]|nr:signal peptidase I [Bacilli bacterium]